MLTLLSALQLRRLQVVLAVGSQRRTALFNACVQIINLLLRIDALRLTTLVIKATWITYIIQNTLSSIYGIQRFNHFGRKSLRKLKQIQLPRTHSPQFLTITTSQVWIWNWWEAGLKHTIYIWPIKTRQLLGIQAKNIRFYMRQSRLPKAC